MRAFLKAHQKLHIWFLTNLILLGSFLLARLQKAWMNALADHVTTPLKTALGRLWGAVPFSVMEVLYTLAAEVAIGYILWSVISVVRTRGHRGRRAYGAALGAAWEEAMPYFDQYSHIVLAALALLCVGYVLYRLVKKKRDEKK